jgi:hypothetical protein
VELGVVLRREDRPLQRPGLGRRGRFEDPPRLTKDLPDGESKLAVYRRVRDEIRDFVKTLPEGLVARTEKGT